MNYNSIAIADNLLSAMQNKETILALTPEALF